MASETVNNIDPSAQTAQVPVPIWEAIRRTNRVLDERGQNIHTWQDGTRTLFDKHGKPRGIDAGEVERLARQVGALEVCETMVGKS